MSHATQRRHFYEKQKGKCHWCGRQVAWKDFTRDHVVPKSKGGTNRRRNIVGACAECNRKRANRISDGDPVHEKEAWRMDAELEDKG